MKKLAFLVLVAFPVLLHAQTDDFNDGNDTGWARFNPIGVGSFSVVNGAYRLRTSPSPDPVNFGPGRAGALRADVPYTDFYVTVDIVDWDTNVNQAFGILARCTEIGPGTTDGYAMTWDAGGRDLDISIFTNERPASVPGQANGPANLIPGRSYRMVFMGQGIRLTGEIYDISNLDTPLASIAADSDRWPSGVNGLIVYDNSSAANGTTDTSFDNYFALSFKPPRLKIQALDFGDMLISWPIEPTNYVLQATSTLGVNWVDITENISEDVASGRRSYTDNLFLQDLRFYRLRP
jgi:hypothetical protein